MRRRRVLSAFALCCAALSAAGRAHANDNRPVRLVVPVPPGDGLDLAARLIAHHWRLRGTQVHVDNKPGANTLVGMELVARAPADGFTLLYGATSLAIAPLRQKTASAPESLAPVIQVSTETFALVSRRGGGLASAADIERVAAARPHGLNCVAAPGAPEIGCEQLKAYLDGRAQTIAYEGLAPGAAAFMGGQADLMVAPLSTIAHLVRGGHVRLVALSSRAGVPDDFPSAPLLSELWKGFDLAGFTGVFAPAGTPGSRIRQLNRELDAVLAEPKVRATMLANVQVPVGGSPQFLEDSYRESRHRFREVLTRLNLAIPR